MKKDTFKKLTRVFLLILTCGFFLPCFTISCCGVEMEVSQFEAMRGFRAEEFHKHAEPVWWLAIFLIIPIFLFIMSYKENQKKDGAGLITFLMTVEAFVFWLFEKEISKSAACYYLDCNREFGYYVNVISMITLLLSSIYYLVKYSETPYEKEVNASGETYGVVYGSIENTEEELPYDDETDYLQFFEGEE